MKMRPSLLSRIGSCSASGLFILCLLFGLHPLHAQTAFAASNNFHAGAEQMRFQSQKVNLKARNERLQDVLGKVEKQVGFSFVYSPDDIDVNRRISVELKNAELPDAVEKIARQIEAEYEIINDKIILRGKTPTGPSGNGSESRNLSDKSIIESNKTAQDITVSGIVTDESSKGISGVSVVLKGTATGTTTGSNGQFSLNIPDTRADGTLVFSYVGYATREVPLNGQRTVNVSLAPAERSLEDVVVVGYGTQRRVSVTGSVDKVTSAAIEGRPVVNVSQALQGVSPNLIIQQRNFEPGQPLNINIRGLGTLNNNDPLVVIDGIIGGDLNLLNPNDIESISILKDAGTAAIYGSRSANGVILVTTKKGRKNEKPTVTYNAIYGVQVPRVTYKPVHAWENAYYKNEALVNAGQSPVFTPEDIQRFQAQGDGDWEVKSILQNAAQQSHNISVSGGSANTTYLFSAGYLNQKSNFIGPDYGYQRYNLRFNQTTDIGRFRLASVLSYTKVYNKDHSFNSGTLIVDASRVPLYYSFQDSAGNYLTNSVSQELNPKGILEKGGYRKSNDDEIFGNLSGELSITKDLKLRGVFGGTVRSNNLFGRVQEVDFVPGGGYGKNRPTFNENYKMLFTNVQLLAEYNKRFGNHNVRVLAGGTNESSKEERNALYLINTDPDLGVPTTGTEIDKTASYSSNGTTPWGAPATIETSINSLIGRAGYDYNNRYFAEFNFRYDGSSKFLKENRWGFFPSGAVAWRVSEENFFGGLKRTINEFKLRSSYGLLGNQGVAAYQYQTAFYNRANGYAYNNASVAASVFALGNADLTWEKAATFNVGVDAGFLKNKLQVSFDYFNKTTRDILYNRQDIPLLFGLRPDQLPYYNVAKVRNRGWEVKADYTLSGKSLRQTFSFNIADNLNELLALTYGAKEQYYQTEEFQLLRRVGQPITVYYGYKRNGYFQNLDDIKGAPVFAGQNRNTISPGDIKYLDRNGDGVIDDNDKTILGNPFPRYTFGFTYTAEYKGLDLSFFIQGVGKRDAMIRGEQVEPFHVGYGGTMYTQQTDYWTPTNPDAKWPRLAQSGSPSNANNYRVGSDLYLFDAAYARLKNVQLGYTLPARWLQSVKLQSVRIYATGQNLATLSKLNFLDPEITEFDNNTSPGGGANSARAYPLPVFYGFGLDVRF